MWWEKVKELIEYARQEKPDAYVVLQMADEIARRWNESQPPATNDPTVPVYSVLTLSKPERMTNFRDKWPGAC